jgi:hypothetical protein
MSARIRLWHRADPLSHVAGECVDIARVPYCGEFLRVGAELHRVGSVVHVIGGDVAADVYCARVEPLPEVKAVQVEIGG